MSEQRTSLHNCRLCISDWESSARRDVSVTSRATPRTAAACCAAVAVTTSSSRRSRRSATASSSGVARSSATCADSPRSSHTATEPRQRRIPHNKRSLGPNGQCRMTWNFSNRQVPNPVGNVLDEYHSTRKWNCTCIFRLFHNIKVGLVRLVNISHLYPATAFFRLPRI